jgi:hypothetical protein
MGKSDPEPNAWMTKVLSDPIFYRVGIADDDRWEAAMLALMECRSADFGMVVAGCDRRSKEGGGLGWTYITEEDGVWNTHPEEQDEPKVYSDLTELCKDVVKYNALPTYFVYQPVFWLRSEAFAYALERCAKANHISFGGKQ